MYMQALFYNVRPLGWAVCKLLRPIWPGCLLSSLNGLTLRNVDVPTLPGDDWVRVRTMLGGICGTDLAILNQAQPPDSILQAYSSMPMILGHENVGIVDEVGPAVDTSWKGKRVCVDPTLGCRARGIDPPCRPCSQGEFGACENFAAPGPLDLPPGTSIGYNSRTGGAFGEYFVAHESQLVAVPESISDAQAALTDPIACSIHAAMRADLSDAKRVLVYGSGVLGLGLIAALRALGYVGRIDTIDRADYLRELAMKLGADDFIQLPGNRGERFAIIADHTSGHVHRSRFGNLMLAGGYDVVFDCVGSQQSLGESFKWTAGRGQVVMVGTGHGGRLDLTPIWFRELTVFGAYGRQLEHIDGRRISTYELAHEWMSQCKLDLTGMLTHTFPLADYRTAFTVAMNKAAHQAVKVAFEFR